MDILCKTLRLPGGECEDGTQDPGINVPHFAQCTMTTKCFVLYHRERCDLHPMLNTINHKNVYNLELQRVHEIKHNNDLYWKAWPKWYEKDPEQSLTKIHEYFETIRGTSKALLSTHFLPSAQECCSQIL